jgi:hypothetical protein
MLQMKRSLIFAFLIWIVGGLAVLVLAVTVASKTICAEPTSDTGEHNQRTHQTDKGPSALAHLLDEPTSSKISLAEVRQRHAETANKQSDQKVSEFPRRVICDAKSTDIGVMFFTYCLVVVGWFGIKSEERNTEAVERAYIFLGYGKPSFRNKRINFALAATNVGRSLGIMKEIRYAFLQRDNLPSKRMSADWKWEIISYDWATPANTRRDNLRRLLGPTGNCIFVSCIEYQDTFTGRQHISWMSMIIRPDEIQEHDRITRAGGDEWNTWD